MCTGSTERRRNRESKEGKQIIVETSLDVQLLGSLTQPRSAISSYATLSERLSAISISISFGRSGILNNQLRTRSVLQCASVSVSLHSFRTVKWTVDELRQIDMFTRKMNMYRRLHPRSFVLRFYSRKEQGGRSPFCLEHLHDKVILPSQEQEHSFQGQTTSSRWTCFLF